MSENEKEVNLLDLQIKLYNRLKDSGWGDRLRTFLLGYDMKNILNALIQELRVGSRFTPPLKTAFRAFEECPWRDLKVVFVASDPYSYPGMADGLAFSCGNKDLKTDKALLAILDEVVRYTDSTHDQLSPDLTRWANQGVLLLNTSLTVAIESKKSHKEIWGEFIAYVLTQINALRQDIIFVFFGDYAKQWEDLIDDSQVKFYLVDPNVRYKDWDSKDVFNQINDLLLKQDKTPIVW